MQSLRKIYYALLGLPLKWLVRINIRPNKPVADLRIDKSKPIYYVLRTRSASSFGILSQQCQQLGLPEPQYLSSKSEDIPNGAVFFVQQKSWFNRPPLTLDKYRKKMQRVVDQHFDGKQDVQLLPVSIHWGRNPGKEKSLFRLLLTDTESARGLRKLLILLFQGRNSFMLFGVPLQLNLIKERSSSAATANKIIRILRVYFHRQWQTAMGPLVADRRQMITSLLARDEVLDAIKREQSSKKISYQQARQNAYKYANEIAANYSYTTVRVMNNILNWLWNKMYGGVTVRNAGRLRKLANEYELVYLPCHRSHIDYLLLSYVLYQEGLVPPHIAAGINLNFWPIGGFLRTGGAFFLRRSFSGNKLYSAVFNNYLYLLLERGYPIEFYPEGGRSRTGRLLQPKTGMMSMTVHAMLKGLKKPVLLVPVYVGYERMLEGKNYVKEMHGKKKQKESMGQLLRVRKKLKQRYGKVFVSFAEPMDLSQAISDYRPDWREHQYPERPNWLNDFTQKISHRVMENINRHAAVNSVNLISLILLSTQRQTLGKQALTDQLSLYLKLLDNESLYPAVHVNKDPIEKIMDDAKHLSVMFEFENPLGNLCQVVPKSAILLTYYRNNIMHLFALPALVASCFRHQHNLSREQVVQDCQLIFPLLKRELFLADSDQSLSDTVNGVIDFLVSENLLEQTNGMLHRPEFSTANYSQLMLLADTLRETLERYGITLTLLDIHAGKDSISRSELESQSQKLAQRISALYNINAPEAFDKSLFQQIVASLRKHEFITTNEKGELVIDERMHDLHLLVMRMLSISTQESLYTTARWAVQRWQQS